MNVRTLPHGLYTYHIRFDSSPFIPNNLGLEIRFHQGAPGNPQHSNKHKTIHVRERTKNDKQTVEFKSVTVELLLPGDFFPH